MIKLKDKPLIKVLTGMRRSGKSSLLLLFKEYLLENKIKLRNIIYINFESMEYNNITNYIELYNYLKSKIQNDKTYILLDEIQQVDGWEKTVNSLLVDFEVDIYITGSNAYLLSSELSTLLSGRYVEIKIYPLSFKEYLDFNTFSNNMTMPDKFNEYLKWGGLPAIGTLGEDSELISDYLSDVYNTVVLKDIIERNQIKDIALLNNIVEYMSQNVGNLGSPKKISDFLNSSGQKTNNVTIDNYLKMLENTYMFYKVSRYDVKGKQLLKTLGKYYIVDNGLRNNVLGFRNTDYGHVLENIVYLELLRRGYKVNIGKVSNLEIDFIATNVDEKKYIQVAYTVKDEEVLDREMKPLIKVKDNYEKIIITADETYLKDQDGIKFINIIDFILS